MSLSKTTALFLHTKPSHFVRKGFALAPQAYEHITRVATTPEGSNAQLQLPVKLAERLLSYCQQFFGPGMASKPTIDCAHFACFMAGIVVSDWQHAMQALDEVRGKALAPRDLPKGHLGIISTPQDLRDHAGFHHILHAGVNFGAERWLNITGLEGNLALSRIADDLAYQRAQVQGWYGEEYYPESVQLHMGPDLDYL